MTSKTTTILGLAAVAGGAYALTSLLGRNSDYDFQDKVVLITGGSRGLGLVMAREFASEGARLVICARDEDELERARIDLESQGAEVMAYRCDLTSRTDVLEMVAAIESRLGGVDVLVNNAGVIQMGPIEVMTQADFEKAMNAHFWAPLHTMMAVLPRMRQKKSGRIVNISSIGGRVSVPHLVPYCASKFALTGLSRGMQTELLKDGIAVTTVCPGLMRTGSPRNAGFKGKHREEYAWFSISDALPLLSVSAERAAREIVSACRRGRTELVISLPAKLAVLLDTLAPEVTSNIFGLANKLLLPGPGGIGEREAKGTESESALSPSWLTTLNERAAVRNNEVLT
ncbi:MAG TPA: SDR family NAD(P)-dependent oxidoreductase [Pyrinomonadaceae bacterium]|nr:SDR family NAD(P)-dependent oxidoreductase [Pyrinomonadaceae bacterium]